MAVKGRTISFLDVNLATMRPPLEAEADIDQLAISRDGTQVAVTGPTGRIAVVDVTSEDRSWRILRSRGPFSGQLAFFATAEYLASADADGAVRVWSISDGELVQSVPASGMWLLGDGERSFHPARTASWSCGSSARWVNNGLNPSDPFCCRSRGGRTS